MDRQAQREIGLERERQGVRNRERDRMRWMERQAQREIVKER